MFFLEQISDDLGLLLPTMQVATGTVEQRMLILVDIERLMTHQELAVVDDVSRELKESAGV